MVIGVNQLNLCHGLSMESSYVLINHQGSRQRREEEEEAVSTLTSPDYNRIYHGSPYSHV